MPNKEKMNKFYDLSDKIMKEYQGTSDLWKIIKKENEKLSDEEVGKNWEGLIEKLNSLGEKMFEFSLFCKDEEKNLIWNETSLAVLEFVEAVSIQRNKLLNILKKEGLIKNKKITAPSSDKKN